MQLIVYANALLHLNHVLDHIVMHQLMEGMGNVHVLCPAMLAAYLEKLAFLAYVNAAPPHLVLA